MTFGHPIRNMVIMEDDFHHLLSHVYKGKEAQEKIAEMYKILDLDGDGHIVNDQFTTKIIIISLYLLGA